MLFLATVVALAWCAHALLGWHWRIAPRLAGARAAAAPLAPPARVVAVVPARNEAAELPRTLPALLAQSDAPHVAFHVILVDDHSTDGTADVARGIAASAGASERLTVLAAAPLPRGWTGKVWAQHQGVEAALALRPDWVWLTDADVRHGPGVLDRLLATARLHGRDLVSVMARLRCATAAEKLLIPAFTYFFATLYSFRGTGDDRSRTAGAAGGCVLVHATLLERIGGMAAIRDAVIDDCALARACKDAGGRLWLGYDADVRSTRGYPTLGTIWDMVARSAYTQLRRSPVILAGCIAGLGLVFFVPLAAVVAGPPAARMLGLVAWAAMIRTYLPMVRWLGCGPAWAAALPLSAALYAAMTVSSAWRHHRGAGAAWKGRAYGTPGGAGAFPQQDQRTEGSTMQLEYRLAAYRFLKPLQWPVSRVFPIPRPTAFVGPGSALRLCSLIGQSGVKRVMIVTDAVLVRLGIVEPLRAALAAHGIDVAVHDAITPDPTYPVLQAGHDAVRAHGSDAILAVGGGSVIDAAKVIDAMVVSGKPPEKLLGVLKIGKPMLPLYAIPTTAGTGSEVTVAAVVTDPVKHAKAAVIDPRLVPAATALDATLMTGMPKPITAATGMDALTHAVEAYVNRWPHADTASHCLSATRMIFANLPRAYEHGDDLEAREAMALAAFQAGLAFTKAYVGYVHAFSHKVGGMYGVPHGLANAITLPYVLDFLSDDPAVQARLADLARAIGEEAGDGGDRSNAALAQRFVARVRELNRTVGIPERIDALRADDVPEIARAAMVEAHRDYPVPKDMTVPAAEALLRRML